MEKIKTFSDNSYIKYDRGNFDDYCVYIVYDNGQRKAPLDTEYFYVLKKLGEIYSQSKIYEEFVKLYEKTKKEINHNILNEITNISKQYFSKHALIFDKTFSILYLAMIAEEKVTYTKLGKRIKRLGVHELLINNTSIDYAANFMRNKKWRELDKLCVERGF